MQRNLLALEKKVEGNWEKKTSNEQARQRRLANNRTAWRKDGDKMCGSGSQSVRWPQAILLQTVSLSLREPIITISRF